MKQFLYLLILFGLFSTSAIFASVANTLKYDNLTSQTSSENDTVKVVEKKKQWYDVLNIRGYAQARYNRFLETNNNLSCEQCDKSWGGNSGFFLRRIRVIIYGQVSKQVYVYIQPDFASAASTTALHFGQIRDAYFDIGMDADNEFRFRIGQSKVPFGFENMQSSQNRLALDRNDALNSAVSNERDLGVFFYWAPKKIRERFSMLVRDGFKGSGDYGVFGIGAYNGQTANKPELNKEVHVAMRISYPFEVGSQIFEPGLQGYSGNFTMPKDQITTGVKAKSDLNYLDQRFAATMIMYPRPFGIMAEYNIGIGPEYNKWTNAIEEKPLEGGYITFNYFLKIRKHILFPFYRTQYYAGGKKHERDARRYTVNDNEIGVEWQPGKNFEFVVMYTISSRRYEDGVLISNMQKGNLLRLQAQVNF